MVAKARACRDAGIENHGALGRRQGGQPRLHRQRGSRHVERERVGELGRGKAL